MHKFEQNHKLQNVFLCEDLTMWATLSQPKGISLSIYTGTLKRNLEKHWFTG